MHPVRGPPHATAPRCFMPLCSTPWVIRVEVCGVAVSGATTLPSCSGPTSYTVSSRSKLSWPVSTRGEHCLQLPAANCLLTLCNSPLRCAAPARSTSRRPSSCAALLGSPTTTNGSHPTATASVSRRRLRAANPPFCACMPEGRLLRAHRLRSQCGSPCQGLWPAMTRPSFGRFPKSQRRTTNQSAPSTCCWQRKRRHRSPLRWSGCRCSSPTCTLTD